MVATSPPPPPTFLLPFLRLHRRAFFFWGGGREEVHTSFLTCLGLSVVDCVIGFWLCHELCAVDYDVPWTVTCHWLFAMELWRIMDCDVPLVVCHGIMTYHGLSLVTCHGLWRDTTYVPWNYDVLWIVTCDVPWTVTWHYLCAMGLWRVIDCHLWRVHGLWRDTTYVPWNYVLWIVTCDVTLIMWVWCVVFCNESKIVSQTCHRLCAT